MCYMSIISGDCSGIDATRAASRAQPTATPAWIVDPERNSPPPAHQMQPKTSHPPHALLPIFKSPAHETLHSLLQTCTSMHRLKQVHARLVTHGLLHETLTVSKLVAFCSLSPAGDLRHAREVFDRVPRPNRFMFNSLIRGYSTSGRPLEALRLLRRMLLFGLPPNHFTLPFVLKSCAGESALIEARLVHALIQKLGFGSQVFVLNSLIHAYAACGSMSVARRVFTQMPNKNVVSWNSMIGAYSQSGDFKEAFGLFREMRDSGLVPDEFTLASLLSVCSQLGNIELGRSVHHYIAITGADVDLIVGNALVDMYGKCGELSSAQTCFNRTPAKNVVSWTSMVCAHAKHGLVDLARSWFDQMPQRSIASWNAMISCYVQQGLCREGLDLYRQMQVSGMMPDEVTLVSVLSACSQIGDLIVGKRVHVYVCEHIVHPTVTLLNSIIDLYAKCGPIDIALDLFNSMPERTVVSWNVIIGGLALHGRASHAIKLFGNMVSEGFLPDRITFISLLCACSHGGLVEAGEYYFEAMRHTFEVPYEIEHYACMVDLLGRGGHLGKAVSLVTTMPMKPDVVIWGAVLGACRIHGNVKIAEQVMKQLLELDPHSGGLYVLVSNMYCETHRWEGMKSMWKLMKERGTRKDKAASLIEIDAEVYEFIVEDTRHETSTDVYFLLDQLTDHLMSECHLSSASGAVLDLED